MSKMKTYRYEWSRPGSTIEVAGKVYGYGDDVTECGPEFLDRHSFNVRKVANLEESTEPSVTAEEE